MKIGHFIMIVVALAILGGGCISDTGSPYKDPTEGRGRTTDLTTYDFQQYTAAMVDSLLGDRQLARTIMEQFPGGTRPVVSIGLVNKTYQFSVTDKLQKSMHDTIEMKLLKSGKFDVVDRDCDSQLLDIIIGDVDSALVKESSFDPFKQGARIDCVLAGKLWEFREGDGRINDCYYKLTMKMYSLRSRKVLWMEEKEIRKVSKRPMVGW